MAGNNDNTVDLTLETTAEGQASGYAELDTFANSLFQLLSLFGVSGGLIDNFIANISQLSGISVNTTEIQNAIHVMEAYNKVVQAGDKTKTPLVERAIEIANAPFSAENISGLVRDINAGSGNLSGDGILRDLLDKINSTVIDLKNVIYNQKENLIVSSDSNNVSLKEAGFLTTEFGDKFIEIERQYKETEAAWLKAAENKRKVSETLFSTDVPEEFSKIDVDEVIKKSTEAVNTITSDIMGKIEMGVRDKDLSEKARKILIGIRDSTQLDTLKDTDTGVFAAQRHFASQSARISSLQENLSSKDEFDVFRNTQSNSTDFTRLREAGDELVNFTSKMKQLVIPGLQKLMENDSMNKFFTSSDATEKDKEFFESLKASAAPDNFEEAVKLTESLGDTLNGIVKPVIAARDTFSSLNSELEKIKTIRNSYAKGSEGDVLSDDAVQTFRYKLDAAKIDIGEYKAKEVETILGDKGQETAESLAAAAEKLRLFNAEFNKNFDTKRFNQRLAEYTERGRKVGEYPEKNIETTGQLQDFYAQVRQAEEAVRDFQKQTKESNQLIRLKARGNSFGLDTSFIREKWNGLLTGDKTDIAKLREDITKLVVNNADLKFQTQKEKLLNNMQKVGITGYSMDTITKANYTDLNSQVNKILKSGEYKADINDIEALRGKISGKISSGSLSEMDTKRFGKILENDLNLDTTVERLRYFNKELDTAASSMRRTLGASKFTDDILQAENSLSRFGLSLNDIIKKNAITSREELETVQRAVNSLDAADKARAKEIDIEKTKRQAEKFGIDPNSFLTDDSNGNKVLQLSALKKAIAENSQKESFEQKVNSLVVRANELKLTDASGKAFSSDNIRTVQDYDALRDRVKRQESYLRQVQRINPTFGERMTDSANRFTSRSRLGRLLQYAGEGKSWGHTGGRQDQVKDEKGTVVGSIFKGGFNGPALALATFGTALSKAAEFVGKFGKAALEAYGEIESVKTNLGVVYGSKSQAEDMFSQISQYATKSPFGVQQTADFAVLLKQSGVYNSDLMDTLKMIGDVSGGNAEKFSRIANNLAQIVAAGKATAMDMRQFANAGLPIYKELAKLDTFKGKSQADIRKMTSEGKVTDDVIMQVFRNMTGEGGTFHDAVKQGAETYKAKMVNLKDTKQLSLAEWGELLFTLGSGETDRNGVGSKILSTLESIYDEIGKLAKDINDDKKVSRGVATLETEDFYKNQLNDINSRFHALTGFNIDYKNLKDTQLKVDKLGELKYDEKGKLTTPEVYKEALSLLKEFRTTNELLSELIKRRGGYESIDVETASVVKPEIEKTEKNIKEIEYIMNNKDYFLSQFSDKGSELKFKKGSEFSFSSPSKNDKARLEGLNKSFLLSDSDARTLLQRNLVDHTTAASDRTVKYKESIEDLIKAYELLFASQKQKLDELKNSDTGKIYRGTEGQNKVRATAEDSEKQQKKNENSSGNIQSKLEAMEDANKKAEREKKEKEKTLKKGREIYKFAKENGITETGGMASLAKTAADMSDFMKRFATYSKADFTTMDELKTAIATANGNPDALKSVLTNGITPLIENFSPKVIKILREQLNSELGANLAEDIMGKIGAIKLNLLVASNTSSEKTALDSLSNVKANFGAIVENESFDKNASKELKDFISYLLTKVTNTLVDKDTLDNAGQTEDNTKEYRPFWERLSSSTLGIPGDVLRGISDGLYKAMDKNGRQKKAGTVAGEFYMAQSMRSESESLAKQIIKEGKITPLEFAKQFVKQNYNKDGSIKAIDRGRTKGDSVDQKSSNLALRKFAVSVESSAEVTETFVNSLSSQIDQMETFFASAAFRMEDSSMVMDVMNPSKKELKQTTAPDALTYNKNNVGDLADIINAFGLTVTDADKATERFSESLPEFLNGLVESTKNIREASATLSAMKGAYNQLVSKTSESIDQAEKGRAKNRGGYTAPANLTYSSLFNILPYETQDEIVNAVQSSLNSNAVTKATFDKKNGTSGVGATVKDVLEVIGKYGMNLSTYSDNADALIEKMSEDMGVNVSQLNIPKSDSEKALDAQKSLTDATDRNTAAVNSNTDALSGRRSIAKTDSPLFDKLADLYKNKDYKKGNYLYKNDRSDPSAAETVPQMIARGVPILNLLESGGFSSSYGKKAVNDIPLEAVAKEMLGYMGSGDYASANKLYMGLDTTNAKALVPLMKALGAAEQSVRSFADTLNGSEWKKKWIEAVKDFYKPEEDLTEFSKENGKAMGARIGEAIKKTVSPDKQEKKNDIPVNLQDSGQAAAFTPLSKGLEDLLNNLNSQYSENGYNENNIISALKTAFDKDSLWVNLLGQGAGFGRTDLYGNEIKSGVSTYVDGAGNITRKPNTAQEDRAFDFLRNSGLSGFENLVTRRQLDEANTLTYSAFTDSSNADPDGARNALRSNGFSENQIEQIMNEDGTVNIPIIGDLQVNNADNIAATLGTFLKLRDLLGTMKETIKDGLTAEFNNSLFTMGKLYNEGKSFSEITDQLKENWTAMAAGMMQTLGPQITQTGLQIAGAMAQQKNWAGVAAGLALAASGGIMSFTGGILSGEDSDDDKDDGEKERIQNLKDALSDLIDQAKTDADYYQKNLLHQTALTENGRVSERKVNDAIITPNGSVVTTHPDDYLIATKTPGSLLGAAAQGRSSPSVSFTIVNASGQNLDVSDEEVSEDDEGNLNIQATVVAVVSQAMADGELDEAFTAMKARQNGYSTVA